MSAKINDKSNDDYPLIYDRVSYSISDAASLCLVEPHVLRYWEKQFDTFNPQKINGRRYYSRQDILAIRKIRTMLYHQRLTIEGARAQINNVQSEAKDNNFQEVIKVTIKSLESVAYDLSLN